MKSTFLRASALVLLVGWLSFPQAAKAQSGLIREVYLNVFGGTVSALTNSANFPDAPDQVGTIPDFEAPSDVGDNYGQRVRGYLLPPISGSYTFWISSDDASALFLSTDDQPQNRVQIARVNGVTDSHQYDRFPSQQSTPITLQSGKRYYVEALHAEGGGGDHLEVRWQLPDGTIEDPIPNSRLLAELTGPQIARQPQSIHVTEGQPATFTIQLINRSTPNFQWLRNSAPIPGETNQTLTLPAAQISDNGARFSVAISNSFGNITSQSATLTVDRDVTPPTLVSASNQGENDFVTLTFSKPLDISSATDISNYQLSGDAQILSAALSAGGQTVVLHTTPLQLGASYTIGVSVGNGIQDRANIPNVMEPAERQISLLTQPLDVATLYGKSERIGPSSRRTGLIVSEIMYHPKSRTDGRNLEFIELYNSQENIENLGGYSLSGTVDYTFPAGAFIQPGGYVVVAPSPLDIQVVYGLQRVYGGFSNNLSNGSGTIRLNNSQGAVLLEAQYGSDGEWPVAPDGTGHSLVLARPSYGEADPRAWASSQSMGGSPGRDDVGVANPLAAVVINEFLAHTDNPQQADFIELYNNSSQPIDISGCFLSDDPATNKFRIKAGTILPPLGFVSFDQVQMGFGLQASGESIFLVNAGGTRVIDAVRFDAQANGISSGRFPDGAPIFKQLSTPTPGAPNSTPLRSSIVINELMYHPISGNDNDQFIELFNRSAAAVDLSGWKLTDAVDFTFPTNTTIGPGGFLVIAKDDLRLRGNYNNLTAANTLGNFKGTLSHHGELLSLKRPDTILTTNHLGNPFTLHTFVLVNAVNYSSGGRWGTWAAGGGSSLELIDPQSDNDYASNWADSDETHKSSWTTIERTGYLNLGGGYRPDALDVFMQGQAEALLDNVQVITNGLNLVANGTFDAGVKGWIIQGTHEDSTWEQNDGNPAGSLHIRAAGRGDTASNRLRTHLSKIPATNSIVTLHAEARWLAGNRDLLLRLHGNWLEAPGRLNVPKNLGTPGLPNSRLVTNAGPAIVRVTHTPVLPSANQNARVSAYVSDENRVALVRLNYRIDPSTNVQQVLMDYNGSGFYSAIIPGQAANAGAAFWIEAVDTLGASARFPNDAPARECAVRFGELQPAGTYGTYHLWLTQTNIDYWTKRPSSSNKGVDATFAYNNDRVVYNMQTLFSGSPFHWIGYNGPLGNDANYLILFAADDLFLGQSDFVLNEPGNAGSREPTSIHEQLFYWMLNELGIPYTYRRFMNLTINGQRRNSQAAAGIIGAFEDAQQPNGDFIAEWFPNDNNGELFKIEDWFEFNDSSGGRFNQDATLDLFQTTNVVTGQIEKKLERYRWNFRKRATDTANDYTNLFMLVDALTNTVTAEYTRLVEERVDIDEWMRVIALRHMACDWDSYGYRRGKNMYAYKPQQSRWVLLNWDVAFAFGVGDGPTESIYDDAHFDGSIDLITDRMLKHPPFRRLYLRALKEAADGPMNLSRYSSFAEAKHAALLANGITQDVASPDDPASLGISLNDWIAARRQFILNEVSSGDAAFAITSNGGNTFSTNRNQITIAGTAPLAVEFISINGVIYPVTWNAVNSWSAQIVLPAATNNIVIQGLDRKGVVITSAMDQITITYTGLNDKPEDKVVFNEIMYNPVTPDTEFIEFVNISRTVAFDLSNYELHGVGFTFPAGTIIPPGGFSVVVKDLVAFTSKYGSGLPVAGEYDGNLDPDGETLTLEKPTASGNVIIDSVRYENILPWPLVANGTGASLQVIDPSRDTSRVGNWTAQSGTSTPGNTNSARATFTVFPLVWVNEIEAENNSGLVNASGGHSPWIELYNSGGAPVTLSGLYLTDDPASLTKWAFPANATVGSKQFLVIRADGAANQSTSTELHTNFRLSPTNGTVELVGTQAGQPVVFDYISYAGLASDHSYGAYPDAQAIRRQSFFFPTPGGTNNPASAQLSVVINEWMAANSSTILDPLTKKYDDWFELYNPGSATADLSGFTLTDTLTNANQIVIPSGVQIPPGGFLLVWADGEATTLTNGQLHVNFKLNQGGEQIGLFTPNGSLVDSVSFGNQTDNVSQGRIPDGGPAPFAFMPTPTPGTANIGSAVSGIKIGNLSITSGVFSLSWNSEPGATYIIQARADLGSGTWSQASTVTASGATSTFTANAANDNKFYRILKQ